jgi:glucokinase
MSSDIVVGVDLGGTKLAAASADFDGNLVHTLAMPTPSGGRGEVLAAIFTAIRRVVEGTGIPMSQVASIGMASAGPLDAEGGMVLEAPNIEDWENVPLAAILGEEFRVPVTLQRDANAAALAERQWGGGRGVDDMVYITVSTGIGGGLILGGKLYIGAGGTAGEIGHTTIDVDGPACYRGHRGCVEAIASGTAIARMARERLAAGQESVLRSLDQARVSAKDVKEGAIQDDRMCLEIFREAGTALGIAVANLANLLNPALVLLGGGVVQPPDFMIDAVREAVEDRAFKRPAEILRIEYAELGREVTLRGAVLMGLEACGAVQASRSEAP